MEPALPGVRPSHMGRVLRSVLVSAACAALLAGCGTDEPAEKESAGGGAQEQAQVPSAASSRVGECAANSPAVLSSKKYADLDVDGDGSADAVRVTPPEKDCPNVLFAKVSGGYLSAQLPIGAPLVVSVFGVSLPGRDSDLVVTRQQHPRGGYQLRVFAAGSDGLAEVTREEGGPLIPFVVTDVVERPLSVDCNGARIVVTEASMRQPAGKEPVWDITETSYGITGNRVTATEGKELETDVPQTELGRKYPALARYAAFPSCRV